MNFGIKRLAVCALLGVFVSSAMAEDAFKEAADRLPSMIERARAAGLPLTLDELNRGRSKPTPEENAASLIHEIGKELDQQSSGWSDIARLERQALRREMSAVKKGLKAYQPVLVLTEKASSMPRLDFSRDWDFGWKTSFLEYATIKQASRLLAVRAQVRAYANDTSGVLADLGRIRSLSTLIADERSLEGVEVSMGTLEVGEKAVERVAAIWSNNDDNLMKLQQFIAPPFHLPSLTEAARGDFYMGVASTRNLGNPQPASFREDLGRRFAEKWDGSSLIREGLPQTLVGQAVLTRHIETWLNLWPLISSDDAPAKRISAIDGLVEPETASSDPLAYIFELLHVSETAVQAPAAEIDLQARMACNRVLVAALRYRISHGSFPAAISDLGIKELDPWTGESIHINSNGDHLRAYSFGPDAKDDGGRTYVELPQQPTLDFDISWARMKGDIVAGYPALIPRTNPVSK